LASKGMGTGKSHQGRRCRGAVACRSGGVVRPVRWSTHRLGPQVLPPLPHSTNLNSHTSPSQLVQGENEEEQAEKEEEKRKEKKKKKGKEEKKKKT
jgi:hypothetical protein